MAGRNILLVLLQLVLVAASASSLENVAQISKSAKYYLPDDTVPVHYNVRLNPQISSDNDTFEGETQIGFEVRKATSMIVLHSANLSIDESATSVTKNDDTFRAEKHVYDETTEMLKLRFNDSLQPGIYTLNMKFSGVLSDDHRGFFKSFYRKEDDWVPFLATRFQKTTARRAFPCWDEPALKATFNISLKHFENYTALSNMPVYMVEHDETDGKNWTHFETTPVMSTNILAFVVSDFAHIANSDGTIKVWAEVETIPHAMYFMSVIERATMALTRFLNSTVRVPKMDHVIVPRYSSRALENWGLIIYLEYAVPFDTGLERFSAKMANVMTVAHELSHQWFGNLVSPASWKYLWMSEGMATYLKVVITDQYFRDWRLTDSLAKQQIDSFSVDDHSAAISISANVNPNGVFMKGAFVYEKPAHLFSMLSHMIGKDAFQAGLLHYIDAHEYSSVTSDELWEAMQDALNRSSSPHLEFQVKDVMDTWIDQSGYPLVTVTRNYTTGDVIIRQEPSIFGADETRRQWWIPINYATKSMSDFSVTKPMHFLKPNDESIVIQGIDADDWIVVNLQQTGYYRVNYDIENWKRIANELNTGDYQKIHVANRIQLMDTAFHLVEARQLDLAIFIKLTNYLRREADSVVWNYVFSRLIYIEGYMRSPRGGEILKAHILNLMNALLETVDYDKVLSTAGDEFNKYVKIQAATLACKLGDPKCRAKAATRLHAYLEDPETNRVPSDAEDWIFCMGLINANQSIWSRLFEAEIRDHERSFYTTLSHLSCTEDLDIITNYLNMTVTENSTIQQFAKPIDVFEQLDLIVPTNMEAVVDFFIGNFEAIRAVTDKPELIIDRLIWKINRQDQLDKLKTFLRANGINVDSDMHYRKRALKKTDEEVAEILRCLKSEQTSNSE